MSRERLMASDLLERAQEEDALTIDALLALLAYAHHQDTEPLMEAREQGARVGSIGQSATDLRQRAEEALR